LWLRFWSAAVYDLQLNPDEFYAMTPRQLDALLIRHNAYRASERDHAEFMLAQLTSAVVNTGFRSPTKPMAPKEFMPSQWETRKRGIQSTSKRMTHKRRKAIAQSIRAMFPDLSRKRS
jgi:hypothetical protein